MLPPATALLDTLVEALALFLRIGDLQRQHSVIDEVLDASPKLDSLAHVIRMPSCGIAQGLGALWHYPIQPRPFTLNERSGSFKPLLDRPIAAG